MSRASIRAAVTDFLSEPPIEGLSFVKSSAPKRVEAKEFYAGLPLGAMSGCGAEVHIRNQHEERASVGGAHGGGKWRTYEVWLVLRFRSRHPKPEDAEQDADAMFDAITDRFHADRTMGGRVFQAGEGPGPDLRIVSYMGRYVENVFHNTYEVRFVVREWLVNT